MIKIKLIISIILIICVLMLSACKKEQPDTSSEIPTSSSSSANTSSAVATEQMSYEEYFSKEREFVLESYIRGEEDYVYQFKNQENNYLYKENLKT